MERVKERELGYANSELLMYLDLELFISYALCSHDQDLKLQLTKSCFRYNNNYHHRSLKSPPHRISTHKKEKRARA